MSRPLQSSLKALEAAVAKLGDEKASTALKAGTDLIKSVKPVYTLSTEQAQKLVAFFDEQMEILYSLLPQLTIKLSVVYVTELFRLFKSDEPHQLWQHVAGKGVLTGLLAYFQTENAGTGQHFEKSFIVTLCQLLNSNSKPKNPKLTTDLRRCIGSFLAGVIAKDEKMKKWISEPKVLGAAGLSDLIAKETEFRIVDTCLEIATRLAPKRSDPQARRAFLMDIFNSASMRATFGEDTCKRLIKIVEEPTKGRTWFEIADQMVAEMGANAERLQRFVAERLVICGQAFSDKDASLRLYLDTEMTFNAFLLYEDEETMVTTSYDNVIQVRIHHTKDSASAELKLKSPPVCDNPSGPSSQASSLSITLQLSLVEMTRFQKALEFRGQAAKLSGHTILAKQSLSLHPTALGQLGSPAPPPLEAKAEILKSFVPSPTPLGSARTPRPLSCSKGVDTADTEKPIEAAPEPIVLASNSPVTLPRLASPTPSVVEVTKPVVRRGVILDSDDDNEEESLKTSVRKYGFKRKASDLGQVDEENPSVKPSRKKLCVENTKKSSVTPPNQPPTSENPVDVNKSIQERVTLASTTSLQYSRPVPPQSHPRDNGTKVKNRPRKATAATRPRRGGVIKINAPRNVQGISQKGSIEVFEEMAIPVQGTNKLINSTAKERSIVAETVGAAEKAAFPVEENNAGVTSFADLEPTVIEDGPVTPIPHKPTRKPDASVLDDCPSSPIRPSMALKRKLLDANALSQRLNTKITEPLNENPSTQRRSDCKVLHRSKQKTAPIESGGKGELDSVRANLLKNSNYKRRPAFEWAAPINPLRSHAFSGPGNIKKPEAGKASNVTHRTKKGIRNAEKVPKYKPSLPPAVAISYDHDDSDAEHEEIGAPPKSEMDEIAEVLTAIQETLLENIQGKFSGVRREARVARANLLENAVLDLGRMQENNEKSFARFMRLEEKCGEVMQDIVGGLEEVDATNQAIITRLNALIREHDEATGSFGAARKPLFPKLPPCLEI